MATKKLVKKSSIRPRVEIREFIPGKRFFKKGDILNEDVSGEYMKVICVDEELAVLAHSNSAGTRVKYHRCSVVGNGYELQNLSGGNQCSTFGGYEFTLIQSSVK